MIIVPKYIDSEAKLIIKKTNGSLYTLPTGWAIDDAGAYDFNNKLSERAFAHGSDMVGDAKVKGRTITIEFDMDGAIQNDHDNMVNLAYDAFVNVAELGQENSTKKYKVAGLSKIKHKFHKGFKQRRSNIVVSLLLADPFRYAATETTISQRYNSEQTATIITFNNASSVDVPLIIRFTPTVEMPSVRIKHIESDRFFLMTDALLLNPKIAIVNGELGTVRRDNDNSINTFSGVFLTAYAGQNNYEYTGKAGLVEIIYTPRWFI